MPIKGVEIKKLRARMGLTQVQLAADLGVTENTVARWERDEMKMSEPAVRLLRSLARAITQKRKPGRMT
jgi:DNA-binding transcriptional regulator YiaG